jgi:hypothetical protein
MPLGIGSKVYFYPVHLTQFYREEFGYGGGELPVTERAAHYNRYRRDYIKTEHSEDLPFWQIVANRLKRW